MQRNLKYRDESGIITGEYGFVTADGYYHVTKYATDERGLFRILKTKTMKVAFPPAQAVSMSPCQPSVCGPNAMCQEVGGRYVCSCLPDYKGSPPNCGPECVINSDCASHLACINMTCQDPCFGTCGFNAECRVVSHVPNCVCASGSTGDPFIRCSIVRDAFAQPEPKLPVESTERGNVGEKEQEERSQPLPSRPTLPPTQYRTTSPRPALPLPTDKPKYLMKDFKVSTSAPIAPPGVFELTNMQSQGDEVMSRSLSVLPGKNK
ncbi:uncharacterized protein [Periplaneta americana]|uniref:uncharacterized protein isoform X2 n=1 Tax=Periplaneta americana TaxID=6978 RepID=UPI0037E7AD2F